MTAAVRVRVMLTLTPDEAAALQRAAADQATKPASEARRLLVAALRGLGYPPSDAGDASTRD